jgi:hypothetical protein
MVRKSKNRSIATAMARWPALSLAVFATWASVATARDTPQPEAVAGHWGAVTGRVVFEGDLDDPAVKQREQVHVYEPISIQQNQRGEVPAILATFPNPAWLVDRQTRGVKNVFVYLKKRPIAVHPSLDKASAEPISLVLHDQLFSPRDSILRIGQSVRMSTDNEITNFSVKCVLNDGFNPLVSIKQPAEWTPKRAEVLPVTVWSALHSAAAATILVVDHPYAVLTKSDGTFRLDNLPEGKHELTVWHDEVGYVAKKIPVTIHDGKVEELPPVKYTIDLLNRRHSAF